MQSMGQIQLPVISLGGGGGCPEIEKKSVDGKYVSYITDEGFRCIDLFFNFQFLLLCIFIKLIILEDNNKLIASSFYACILVIT